MIAKKAQYIGVDTLFIGSELEELTQKENLIHWIELIGKVKRVFKGRILYAANGNLNKRKVPEYKWVPFWSLLDGIAINYYPPFTGTPNKKSLKEHHLKNLKSYKSFTEGKKQPLIIGEVGFPLAREGINSPFEWRFSNKSKAAPELRALSLSIFMESVKKLKIKEVHYWRFYHNEEQEHPLGYLWDEALIKELKK